MSISLIIVILISCVALFIQARYYEGKLVREEAAKAIGSVLQHFEKIRFANRKLVIDLILEQKMVVRFDTEEELAYFISSVAPISSSGIGFADIEDYGKYFVRGDKTVGELFLVKKGADLIVEPIVPWSVMEGFVKRDKQ